MAKYKFKSAKKLATGEITVYADMDGEEVQLTAEDAARLLPSADQSKLREAVRAASPKTKADQQAAATTPEEAKAAAEKTAADLEQQQNQQLPGEIGGAKLPPGIDAAYVRLAQNQGLITDQAAEAYGEAGQMDVPGYPGLSVARYMNGFFQAPTKGFGATQKALIAAGYMDYDKDMVFGDVFDPKVRGALEHLVNDSIMAGVRPEEIIRYRTELRAGHKPGALQPAGQERADWEKAMRESYSEAWGNQQQMPADYLADKTWMNPEELGVYERSKVLWQKSSVAQDEQDKLQAQLLKFFNQAPSGSGAQGLGALGGNTQLPSGALGGVVPTQPSPGSEPVPGKNAKAVG